jgi:hypothetical protein
VNYWQRASFLGAPIRLRTYSFWWKLRISIFQIAAAFSVRPSEVQPEIHGDCHENQSARWRRVGFNFSSGGMQLGART